MAEECAEALDDRKPETQSEAPLTSDIVDLIIFLENRFEFRLSNAQSRVPDFNPHPSRKATAAYQNPAVMSVFQGVREEIADHLLQEARIAPNVQPAARHAESEAGRLGMIRQLVPQSVQNIVHGEVGDIRLDGAHFDLIDIE